MCFRPPTAQKPVRCPQCGALNPPINKQCNKCKAKLEDSDTNNSGNNSNKSN